MSGDRELSVRDLCVETTRRGGGIRLVDEVSLDVPRGGTLALVGESGCGKSLTALAVMGLLPRGLHPVRGSVRLGGTELLSASAAEVRALRGRRIAMIFQEPMTALNPLMSVGEQVTEAHRVAAGRGRRDARTAATEGLARVGIADASRRMRQYPHELSGGMRQRVMIAMALAARPALLIADEPTTALDVTIQAQILGLLRELQRESGMSLLLITHDLGVVARMADVVAVMYAGRIVERAPSTAFFARPLHPYSRGLLACVPPLDRRPARLTVIDGVVPPAGAWPDGCRFHPRCDPGRDDHQCRAEEPSEADYGPGRSARCWKIEA